VTGVRKTTYSTEQGEEDWLEVKVAYRHYQENGNEID